MCGIVAAASQREVSEILLEGLRRLEYRGYDSAGMALIDNDQALQLHKCQGKVKGLEEAKALTKEVGADNIVFKTIQVYNFENGNDMDEEPEI